MSGIAVKFGVPVWKIVYDNQLKDKNQIVPGQALLLLEVDEGQAEESTQPELAKGKTIGGYAVFNTEEGIFKVNIFLPVKTVQ